MEHTKHVIRAVLLLVLFAIVFVLVRHFAIPETFGEHGHFRTASVVDHAAPPPVHGALGACGECHDEEGEAVTTGKHSTVSCEVCHAPLARHVVNDEKIADMPVHRTVRLCGRCHEKLVARPPTFPQVDLVSHVTENQGEMSEAACLECHDAHNPSE